MAIIITRSISVDPRVSRRGGVVRFETENRDMLIHGYGGRIDAVA